MVEENRKILMHRLAENLEILRIKLGVNQQELADMIGMSRFTIIAIENKKSSMTWSTFLALLMIFTKNQKTDELLTVFKIYTEDLNEMLKLGKNRIEIHENRES